MRRTLSSSRRALILRGAALAACTAALSACDRVGGPSAQGFRGIDITGAEFGRGFALPDHTGSLRRLPDFGGQVVLLYFGFVQCPDVCPTALARAAEVKRMLGPDGRRLQVIFVTVDPERDTPQILAEYMAAFDPAFIALVPSAQQLAQVAADFRIYYRKVPTGSSYTMDHSSQSYLFDPQGRLRVMLRHAQSAEDYAHDVRLLLRSA